MSVQKAYEIIGSHHDLHKKIGFCTSHLFSALFFMNFPFYGKHEKCLNLSDF